MKSFLLNENRQFLATLLLVNLVVHLPFLFSPPDEVHTWRQCSTAAVARNYLEEDANFFHPSIDERGATDGITGMEFPLYNYIVYLGYKLFGFWHPLGKWVSFLFANFVIVIFFNWAILLFNLKVAKWATFVLVTSVLFFSYSSKIMPETTALFFHVISLYFFTKHLQKSDIHFKNISISLLIALLSFSISILIRPYQGTLAIFLLLLWINIYGIRLFKRWNVYAFGIITIFPFLIWYFGYVPMLVERNQLGVFYMGSSINQVINIIMNGEFNIFEFFKVFAQGVTNWGQFGISLIIMTMIFLGTKFKNLYISSNIVFAITTIIISIIFLTIKAGNHYFGHRYYLFGLLPYFALIIGWLIPSSLNILIPKREKIGNLIIIVIIVVALFATEGHHYFGDDYPFRALEAGEKIQKIISKDSLIAVNDSGKPIMLYFFNRKGWSISEGQMLNKDYVNKLKSKGLRFLVFWSPEENSKRNLDSFPLKVSLWYFQKQDLYIMEI